MNGRRARREGGRGRAVSNDRDLLAGPNCGLTEDVLASGQLITNVDSGQPDTGLRFIEHATEDGAFVCPSCGAEARAQQH